MEFGFDSFEDAEAYFNKPTYYEQNNGIKEVRRNTIEFSSNVKGIEIIKSDGTTTLVIFYKSKDRWIYWCPSKSDIIGLERAINLYKFIDEQNNGLIE